MGKRSFGELRRDAGSKGRNAGAYAAKYYRRARCPRPHCAGTRADAGRDRAEDVSIATAAGTGLQSEDPEYHAEHDPGARYGGILIHIYTPLTSIGVTAQGTVSIHAREC